MNSNNNKTSSFYLASLLFTLFIIARTNFESKKKKKTKTNSKI
jgi:hypothetical protein